MTDASRRLLRRPTPSPPPRSRLVQCRATSLVAALAAGLLVASFAPESEAARTPLGIEIDGNYEDDAAPEEDWYPDFPPMRDPIGSDDDTLCGTSPAPKNDITSSFLANNADYLFVAMERLTNNGNTSFFFSFDITGDGPSSGDFIFVFCFGSGSVVTDTFVLEWDEAAGEFVRDATPPEVVFSVNTSSVLAPFGTLDERGRPSPVIGPGRFAEARITLADIEGFDICIADAVVGEIQTKSSCSLSSECKDTTGPFIFSFEPVTTDLEVAQPPSCEPVVLARANVADPAGPVTYTWFLNGVDITDRDPSWASSDAIAIPLEDECGPTEVSVVADDGTCTAEDSATIDVNRRPEAVIGTLEASPCGMFITYDATGSTDCNGEVSRFAWDFDGDGLPDATDASGTWPVTECGLRPVTLVVADSECLSEPVSQLVHVNEPPSAALSVVPGDCLEVSWAVASTDCDLGRPSPLYEEALVHEIDFGDGSPPIRPATGASGTHAYEDCGSYLLTLTTTDASGCLSVDTREVTFTGILTVD